MVMPIHLESVSAADIRFAFYPDVSLDWPNDHTIAIKCPWLSAEIGLSVSVGETARRPHLINHLAASLAELPLVAIISRQAELDCDRHSHEQRINSCLSIWHDQNTTLPFPPLPKQINIADVKGRIFRYPNQLEIIANESKIGEQISAVCAFSAIRHNIFDAFKRGDTSAQYCLDLATIRHCLQQSYFVTSQSVAALSRGLQTETPPGFRDQLRTYITQEIGHHRLVRQALIALGDAPQKERVSAFSRYAMELLGWTAEHNGFALANCLSYFEMGGFLERDPIADAPAKEFPHQYARARVMGCY